MSPNLPVGGSAFDLEAGARHALPEDLTQLALSLAYLAARDTFGPEGRVMGEPSIIEAVSAALALRHHFGEGWSASLALPVGLVELSTIEGRDRIAGFGDLEVAGAYDLAALWGAGGYRPSLVLSLGATLPSGERRALSAPGAPPNLVAVGTGAFGVRGELMWTQFVHRRIALTSRASVARTLSRAEGGLLLGTHLALDAGALWLPHDRVVTSLGVSALLRDRADEEDEGEVLSSGGALLAAAVGVGVRLSDRLSLSASGRIPFFRAVNGTQVSESFGFAATLVVSFGGKDDEEADHDHADHDHASAPTAPMDWADLSVGGAAFEPTPAPGKVTVIDFWAEWCAPCREVEARLRALAAEHDLAVRRVEIPDYDCPAAARLTGTGLPEVWIYDRTGARVFAGAGLSPAEVIERVRAALE